MSGRTGSAPYDCAGGTAPSNPVQSTSPAQQPLLTRRSEEDRLRYILQKIADFPCIGEKAAQQMQLLAKGALAARRHALHANEGVEPGGAASRP